MAIWRQQERDICCDESKYLCFGYVLLLCARDASGVVPSQLLGGRSSIATLLLYVISDLESYGSVIQQILACS